MSVKLVLFVDASVSCRDAQTVLERETAKLVSTLGSCRFIVVNNALEALEAAETLNLDLIIVQEYVIPMYCMAFVQILRNAGCPVPVIVNKAEHCLSLTGDEKLLFCGFICQNYSINDLCRAITLALDPIGMNRNSLNNDINGHTSVHDKAFHFNPDKNTIDLKVLNAVTQLASDGSITDYSMLRGKVKAKKCDDTYMASLLNPAPALSHNIFVDASKALPDYVDYGFQLMPNISAAPVGTAGFFPELFSYFPELSPSADLSSVLSPEIIDEMLKYPRLSSASLAVDLSSVFREQEADRVLRC